MNIERQPETKSQLMDESQNPQTLDCLASDEYAYGGNKIKFNWKDPLSNVEKVKDNDANREKAEERCKFSASLSVVPKPTYQTVEKG